MNGIDRLDLQVIEELRQLSITVGKDVLGQAVGLFSDAATRRMAALHEAADSGQPDRLKEPAHLLKGSSAILGALRLSSLCAELEQQAAKLDHPSIQLRIAEIEDELRATCEALQREGGKDRPFDPP